MLRKNFMKFESTSELHKELTNILLLATEDSNFFYCYCEKNGRKCDLCDLCHYLFDDNNLMEGLPPKKFLQLNYDKREKLEEFADKVFHFLKEWNITTNVLLIFLIRNMNGFAKTGVTVPTGQ